jgi:hypothetical protein
MICCVSVLRGVIGLTIWIDAVATVVLLVPQSVNAPFWLEIPMMVIVLSHYVWMSLRWSLVLTLMIRNARTRRLRTGARAMIRLAFAGAGHVVLGLLSLMGWLLLLINTRRGEPAMGFVLHAVVPSLVVAVVARGVTRSRAADSVEVGASVR